MLTAHLKPTFFAEWIIVAWGLQCRHRLPERYLPGNQQPHPGHWQPDAHDRREFVTSMEDAFQRNGPLFVPAPGD
jgi:hypothetical protein